VQRDKDVAANLINTKKIKSVQGCGSEGKLLIGWLMKQKPPRLFRRVLIPCWRSLTASLLFAKLGGFIGKPKSSIIQNNTNPHQGKKLPRNKSV
jgi:hypothetical protein